MVSSSGSEEAQGGMKIKGGAEEKGKWNRGESEKWAMEKIWSNCQKRGGREPAYQRVIARVLEELVRGLVVVDARPFGGGGPDRGEGLARGDGGDHVDARVGVHC